MQILSEDLDSSRFEGIIAVMGNAFGIDIGGTKWESWTGDSSTEVHCTTGAGTTAAELEDSIAQWLRVLPTLPAALGVAVPGIVRSGRVEACDVIPGLAGWYPDPRRWGVSRVALVNDLDAALLGEKETWPTSTTGAVVFCGTAIGCGVLIEGSHLSGASGWAGELGYLPVRGAEGVMRLDLAAGGAAILQKLGASPEEVMSRCDTGEALARETIREAGEQFGLALAGLLNLLNPSRLTLGGGTLKFPGYLDATRTALKDHALPESFGACVVRVSESDERLVARGAARACAIEMGATKSPERV